MTKKELILGTEAIHESKSFNLLARLEGTSLVVRLTQIYSQLLSERISARRTLKLVHAQLAMGAFLLLGGASILLAVILCVWTVLAVWQCRA